MQHATSNTPCVNATCNAQHCTVQRARTAVLDRLIRRGERWVGCVAVSGSSSSPHAPPWRSLDRVANEPAPARDTLMLPSVGVTCCAGSPTCSGERFIGDVSLRHCTTFPAIASVPSCSTRARPWGLATDESGGRLIPTGWRSHVNHGAAAEEGPSRICGITQPCKS